MAQSTIMTIGKETYRFEYPTVATKVAIASTKAILTRGSEGLLQFSDPQSAELLEKLATVRSLVYKLDKDGNTDFSWDVTQLDEEDAGIVDELYREYTKWRDNFRKERTSPTVLSGPVVQDKETESEED